MKSSINIDTKYKVKLSFDDIASVNDVLVSYYLPLIRVDAFSLYNALLVDGRNTMINTLFINIDRLVSMINLSHEALDKAIRKLELVNLVEVFKEDENHFLFILQKPLTPQEFNNSFQLSELFKSKSGVDNLDISNKLFNSMREIDIEGKESVTEETNLNISSDGITKDRLNVEFDFTSIKSILHARNIDYSTFWSKEIENKLLDLIVVYRVSSLDIGVEIITLVETTGFDLDALVEKIKNDFVKDRDINSIAESGEATTQVKLDFMSKISTRDFFVTKLNREPSNSEQEMISTLKTKYNFNDEIINILVDFSVIVNSGAVNIKYILKIADTLLKEGFTTAGQVTKHLKVAYNLRKEQSNTASLDSKKLMKEIPEF